MRVCDQCRSPLVGCREVPLAVTQARVVGDARWDFCSRACLAEWAVPHRDVPVRENIPPAPTYGLAAVVAELKKTERGLA